MTFKIEPGKKLIFSDKTFEFCFSELFASSEGLLAPLSYIIKEYPLAVAKGGSAYLSDTGEDESDMSYLTHALNACIIGGKMMEMYAIDHKKDTDHMEKQIRLFFSAMVLHDINKIFYPGKVGKAWRLDEVFDSHRADIVKMIGSYMDRFGPPQEWLNDLKYLILITEERTRELAGSISTTLQRQELEEIGRYLKLGDQVSSGTGGTDSTELFLHVKRKFSSFDDYNGEEYANSLHFIKLPNIPQTLLRLEFIDKLTEELLIEKRARYIVFRTPDSIIYYGDPIDSSFVETLTKKFREHLNRSDASKLNQYHPGPNKYSWEWAKGIHPAPDILDKYINTFYNRLLLWSGSVWRKSHPDFPSISFSKWGIEIETLKGNPPKFKVKKYEDNAEDPDIVSKEMLVKISAAKRMLLEFEESEDDNRLIQENLNLVENADAIQKKTVLALAYAGQWKEKSDDERQEEYNRLLEKLSELVSNEYPSRGGITSEDVRYLLGQALPGSDKGVLEVPDKTEACIQCGRYSEEPMNEDVSFGFKPTAGGGKKLSRLIYDEKYNGKICNLCLIENKLRKDEFKSNIGKDKNALSLQIFLGDFVSPVDISQMIPFLEDNIEREDDGNLYLKLSEREKVQLNYHALVFIDRPHSSDEVPQIASEFYLLRKLLKFISRTGFKVHITPLFNSEIVLKPIFTWENSPGWVKELHWDAIRIDEVLGVLRDIEFIQGIANIGRGSKDLPDVIAGRLRGPAGLLRKMWEYGIRSKKKNAFFGLRDNFYDFCKVHAELLNMEEMDKMVEAITKMVYKPPETNNDDRWAIQRAFEVYERGVAEKWDAESLTNRIAGRLREDAYRDEENNRKIVDVESVNFARSFVELMIKKYGGKVPRSESRRDIEAEFALLYHNRKWDSIKKKEGV